MRFDRRIQRTDMQRRAKHSMEFGDCAHIPWEVYPGVIVDHDYRHDFSVEATRHNRSIDRNRACAKPLQ